jgi:glycosyltransferase involved in cell wall biosynthesis
MRICLVSQEYPPETARGGIGSQTHAKAHGLASRGHEICVVSAAVEGRARECRDGPVRVFRVPGFDSRMCLNTEPARWLTYSAEVAAALSKLHREAPFHLVDFPEYGAEGYIWLLNRAAWDYVPAVLHLHGPLVMFAHTLGWPEVDSEFYRTGTAMESACFRLADAVYSSSSCSAAWCTRYYGARRGPIPTIHTGVDINLFQPDAAAKATRPTVVFAGRIDCNKGVSTLVEAVCVLAREFAGLRLRIIGDGDPELIQSLRARARDCRQADALEFTGYVPREELASHLAGAHIFAAPSIYEGGPGLVYLEAMACGLPVIACRGNGASEVVRHEESGLLVPPRDVPAVVEALRALISNADLRRSMGLQARHFVEAEADTRNCLDRLEAFYRSAAHQEAA